eukprot:3525205-Pyramimonas_sp.AAC.1
MAGLHNGDERNGDGLLESQTQRPGMDSASFVLGSSPLSRTGCEKNARTDRNDAVSTMNTKKH